MKEENETKGKVAWIGLGILQLPEKLGLWESGGEEGLGEERSGGRGGRSGRARLVLLERHH